MLVAAQNVKVYFLYFNIKLLERCGLESTTTGSLKLDVKSKGSER